jgi:Uma2 family endonuclease
MATAPSKKVLKDSDYPDSDGRPMAETPQHRRNMTNTIETLYVWFEGESQVYVSGNMFVYYVPGNLLRHVSPDVFVTRDIPKLPERRRYLVWKEGKGPDVVIEVTSKSTREEDLEDKFRIYQDILRVEEYFLFDPFGEYLKPPLQGYRLVRGRYVRTRPVKGRLPSKVLGLHLERDGWQLRLYDPKTRQRLLIPAEEHEARVQAEAAQQQAVAAQQQAEAGQQREAAARQQAEAEVERLRQELEALRRRVPRSP